MNQYVVYAHDHTDGDALQRRLNARPRHFEGARKLKAADNFIMGGAILDDDGKMIGSTLFLQFETGLELDEWLKNEPYITGNVWDKIEIKPFKIADV